MEIDQLTNDLSDALDKVIAKRRRTQIFAISAGVIGVSIAVGIVLTQSSDDRVLAVLPLVLAFLVYRRLSKSFAKSLAGFTMPILCDMAGGYTYAPEVPPENIRKVIELGLLPNKGQSTDRNLISGTLGDTGFQSWSSRILITENDRTKPVFQGFVLQFSELHNGGPNPNESRQTSPSWAQSRVDRTNAVLDDSAQYFDYVSTATESYLAITDTSPPFHVGGLFAGKALLLREMHRAMGELSLPGKLLEIWQSD